MYGVPAIAYHVFDRIADRAGPVWSITEAHACVARDMAISRAYVAKIHSQVESLGMIVRLRRDLYAWPDTARQKPYERCRYPAAPVVLIATNLVSDAALSHASALVALGILPDDRLPPYARSDRSCTCVSASPVVMPAARRGEAGLRIEFEDDPAGDPRSDFRGRRRSLEHRLAWEVGDHRYVYMRVARRRLFGFVRAEIDGNADIATMTAERAALACLEHPWLYGGIEPTLTFLAAVTHRVDNEKVWHYVRRIGDGPLNERVMRWLGEPMRRPPTRRDRERAMLEELIMRRRAGAVGQQPHASSST